MSLFNFFHAFLCLLSSPSGNVLSHYSRNLFLHWFWCVYLGVSYPSKISYIDTFTTKQLTLNTNQTVQKVNMIVKEEKENALMQNQYDFPNKSWIFNSHLNHLYEFTVMIWHCYMQILVYIISNSSVITAIGAGTKWCNHKAQHHMI